MELKRRLAVVKRMCDAVPEGRLDELEDFILTLLPDEPGEGADRKTILAVAEVLDRKRYQRQQNLLSLLDEHSVRFKF